MSDETEKLKSVIEPMLRDAIRDGHWTNAAYADTANEIARALIAAGCVSGGESWLADAARDHAEVERAAADDVIAELRSERDALARFKAFVHHRLDDAGVPTHIDGPHSREGCRIGDRLDYVFNEREVLRDELHDAQAAMSAAGVEPIMRAVKGEAS